MEKFGESGSGDGERKTEGSILLQRPVHNNLEPYHSFLIHYCDTTISSTLINHLNLKPEEVLTFWVQHHDSSAGSTCTLTGVEHK